MNNPPFLLCLLTLGFCAAGSPALAETLAVRVTQVAPGQGNVTVALWSSQKDFKAQSNAVASATVPASAAEVTLQLKDLPAGRYGVTVYQDVNSNGKLDRTFIGKPVEPYGFANDARGRLGPPAFEDFQVSLGGDSQITLKLGR